MKVTPIKTPLVKINDDLFAIIKSSIKEIPEESVLVVTSKIVATCEGRVVPVKAGDRDELHNLVRSEAERYIDPNESRYDLMLTVRDKIMSVNAGIDRSNAGEHYILLPKDSQQSANKIWQFVRQEYGVKNIGVIIVDSKTYPLKWGTIGTYIAHCGFLALRDRIGDKDLFGREMKMTTISIAEAIAASAVLEMGEVDEQTPLCLIEDIKQIEFHDHQPTKKELSELLIELEDDLFAPILMRAKWKKGGA